MPIYELITSVEFPAAHHLQGYPGNCGRNHGHNWKVEVKVRGKSLDRFGMVVDFQRVKELLQEVTAPWDHEDLNALEDFAGLCPSAEVMAEVAFHKMAAPLSDLKVRLHSVTVWESENCRAVYYPDSNDAKGVDSADEQ